MRGYIAEFFFAFSLLLCPATSFAFEVRGMHIDMRTEVMTMDALKNLASKAAAGGINTLVMEWEGTFPFVDNSTICNDEAYTRDEIRDFVKYCTSLGIDVIPLQNCFGHCEYILRHERYASVRESRTDFSQVCPCHEKEAREIFGSIFSEIAELHPSKYIHIGADETRLLGECRKCAAKVAAEGKSKLFCDYVCAMCEVVRSLGKTPIIWADILTKYPQAAGNLPKDLVILDWNYGWSVNYFGDFEKLTGSGLTMWGAPALRSHPDDLHLTQWMKHFNNLKDYVSFVRDLGFKGIVETSWSTSGQYGYALTGQWGVIDIQPMRMVYPLSGFSILQQAFCEAASSDKPFEPEEFILRYCKEHFGFDDEQAGVMLDYFNLPQNVFTLKNRADIPAELEATESMRLRLKGLKPRKGREEFEHFRLMLDIRANYLRFARVKWTYESEDFNASMKESLSSELKPVLKECRNLQKRYCRLNAGYLKNPEKAFGHWGYLGDMENICTKLLNRY